MVFNFFHGSCPIYMADMFDIALEGKINTRSSYRKLKQPFRKTNMGQNSLSYSGPGEWNKLPNTIKMCQTLNKFKHLLKKYYLDFMKEI